MTKQQLALLAFMEKQHQGLKAITHMYPHFGLDKHFSTVPLCALPLRIKPNDV